MHRRLTAFFMAICLIFLNNVGLADVENDIGNIIAEAADRGGKMAMDTSYECTFDCFVRGVEYEIIRTEETGCGMNFYVNFFYVDFNLNGSKRSVLREYAAPYMIICKYEDDKLIIVDVLDAWAAGDLLGIYEYESILENVFVDNFNSYPALARKWWDDIIDNIDAVINDTCEAKSIIVLLIERKDDD